MAADGPPTESSREPDKPGGFQAVRESGPAPEPLSDSAWPRCAAAISAGILGGEPLTCFLPAGHEYDGEPMHRDPVEGVQWSWTVTADG